MCWEYLSSSEPRARKQYTCGLCGLPIKRGVKHVVINGKVYGDFVSDRRHAVCNEVLSSVLQYGDLYGGDEFCFQEELGLPLLKTMGARNAIRT